MELHAMQIDGHTKLAFVLGHPVTHSLSPAMHRAAFAATGINAAYLPWVAAPDRLAEAVRGLRAMENLLGANVTVPHKGAIVPLLNGLTPEAEAFGAVNTLLPRDGQLSRPARGPGMRGRGADRGRLGRRGVRPGPWP